MPKRVAGLWLQVGQQVGFPVPDSVRAFCDRMGWVGDWQDEADDAERGDTFEYIVKVVQCLNATGLLSAASDQPIEPRLPEDGRWQLIRDLRDDPDYAPIRVSQGALATLASDRPDSPLVRMVEVRIDNRVALNTLVRELRRAWPEMRRRGWVRQTRALGEKMIALVRFVCVEMEPGSTWEQVRTAWNARYPEWSYKAAPGLAKDFRRAEESLTGEPYGLEEHYNPLFDLGFADLHRAARAGDKRAKRLLARRVTSLQNVADALSNLAEPDA